MLHVKDVKKRGVPKHPHTHHMAEDISSELNEGALWRSLSTARAKCGAAMGAGRTHARRGSTTSGTNCWSTSPTQRWDLCFRLVLEKGQRGSCSCRATLAGESPRKRPPRLQQATYLFSSLNECRAGAGVLLATLMSCHFSSARAESVSSVSCDFAFLCNQL